MIGERTSVYCYYDGNNILIYVGITSTGIRRNLQHNDQADWWFFTARQEVEHFETREQAHRREIELIGEFEPPFNIQHNPNHRSIRSAYLTLIGKNGEPPDAIDSRPRRSQITQAESDKLLRRLIKDPRTRWTNFVGQGSKG